MTTKPLDLASITPREAALLVVYGKAAKCQYATASDFSRFERSHAHEICLNFEAGEGLTALSRLFGRADEQYAALLAECKRQREQIKTLREALEEIEKGAGPFSCDPLTHASNTIDAMKEQARAALAATQEDK